MIYLKTDEEIELMRVSNLLVGKTLGELSKWIAPGITTLKLDKIAEEFIRDNGGVPGFLGYGGFPATLCVSVNETVVHGIPSSQTLREGDIVSIDCGAVVNGYNGDSAYTFAVGEVDEKVKHLLEVTKASLYLGIEQAIEGNRIGHIGNAIQDYCEHQGFTVVREMTGHGIGKKLHEEPAVPNYGRRGVGALLKSGMCIAIEPMINLGTDEVYCLDDDWTQVTADGSLAAHYENTVAITEDGPRILTLTDGGQPE